MNRLTAAQQRLLDNATLIAAMKLSFLALEKAGTPIFMLDEVAKTTSGGTPSRNIPGYFEGNIPWIKSGELNDGVIQQAEEFITDEGLEKSSAKIFSKGTVVVALYGATVGKTGILAIDAATNQAVCAVIPKTDSMLNRYLFWFLRSKRQDFLDVSFGGAQPNISQDVLRKTPIPIPSVRLQSAICDFLEAVEQRQKGEVDVELPTLPPPLTEQRRIVARIESLAAKVEAARMLREKAVAEMKALFASATEAIFTLKTGWQQAKVGDFCEQPQYGYTESATNQPIGPHFLRITDIQDGQVNWDSVPFCNCPNPEKYLLQENDILFARTGGTTGKSYLVKECPQAVFASYLIRLRVEKWVTPDYLYCYFQSPSYWKQVIDNKKGTGQPNVNGRKLAEIEVPIPPLPEQHRIVAHLDALQAKLALVQQHQAATQARLDALLPSLLDRAFKGEL